jgi:hypothetical protein
VSVEDLLSALHQEAKRRTYIRRLEVLDRTSNLLKARLHVSPGLFVQVYRNDHFDTTNLVLIYNERRVYARDQVGGTWHRHTITDPDAHDTSREGQRAVSLSEFLDEVEDVLTQMDLP